MCVLHTLFGLLRGVLWRKEEWERWRMEEEGGLGKIVEREDLALECRDRGREGERKG